MRIKSGNGVVTEVVRRFVAASALLGVPFAAGCNLNEFTVNTTAPVLKIGSAALDTESDLQFAREAAPASIKTVEAFLYTSPTNAILLEVTAKGYAEYTFGFVEDDIEALPSNADEATRQNLVTRATTFYDRAFKYALDLAALRDKSIREAIKGDANVLDKLLKERFTRAEDGIALQWLGLSLGSGINLNKDDIGRVADLPKVVLLLERAHELNPAYANHSPALALGTVYGSQGKAMGGDPDTAKKMFEEVIAATGGKYLMAKVLYARTYGAVAQDRAFYIKTLQEVLDTPASVMPEQRLANELAKRRAARYIKDADDLFLPPETAPAADGSSAK